MIRASFEGTGEKVAAGLRSRGGRVEQILMRRMSILALELQKKIVTEKLQGQVLHHRSGKLAASIRALPTKKEGGFLVADVQGGGGPAFYGRIHEFGGTRSYEIRPRNKKALAFFGSGSGLSSGKQHILARKLSKPGHHPKLAGEFWMAGGVVVKSVMHPPLPMRSFMRVSLAEMRQEIINGIRQAMVDAATK